MSNPNLQALSDAGVSIWLDDLSRELLESGRVADLITDKNVVGLTSNPSIFQAALAQGHRYSDDLAALTHAGKSVDEVVHDLTTEDVRDACQLFLPIYERTAGVDGRVSIEHYGASADYERIYREYGVTAQAVADAAVDSIRVSGG